MDICNCRQLCAKLRSRESQPNPTKQFQPNPIQRNPTPPNPTRSSISSLLICTHLCVCVLKWLEISKACGMMGFIFYYSLELDPCFEDRLHGILSPQTNPTQLNWFDNNNKVNFVLSCVVTRRWRTQAGAAELQREQDRLCGAGKGLDLTLRAWDTAAAAGNGMGDSASYQLALTAKKKDVSAGLRVR